MEKALLSALGGYTTAGPTHMGGVMGASLLTGGVVGGLPLLGGVMGAVMGGVIGGPMGAIAGFYTGGAITTPLPSVIGVNIVDIVTKYIKMIHSDSEK